MLTKIFCVLVAVICISGQVESHASDDALILTDYIGSNRIKDAKNDSLVKNLPNSQQFDSYSGYITVDKRYNSNLFFWFFPSQVCPLELPKIFIL